MLPQKFQPRLLFLTLSLFLCCITTTYAQEKVSISGYVKDQTTGEDLIGATIYVKEINNGAQTNSYGYYFLNLDTGTYVFRVNYIGYEPYRETITLKTPLQKTFNLKNIAENKEVIIRADAPTQELEKTQMSKVDLQISKVKDLPALFGEVDVLKTIQLLPGVQSGSEGSTGFFVRGGGPDQNLIILDEAVVYNASHLFGFFSVFNSDAIKNVELYKGGFPARFGGRLSSVIDVNLKDGNKKKFAGAGGLGIIASRLTLEGPIVKDKASFIVSGRRTYFDVFTRGLNRANKDKEGYLPIPDYYFYDLNAKVNYELGPRDRLFLSGYFGRDVFGINQDPINFGFDWGNATATARWNHLFNPKLFSNTTFTFTNYKYDINAGFDLFEFNIGSFIKDYTIKTDFDWNPKEKHNVKFGGQIIYHDFVVGRVQFGSADDENSFNNQSNRKGTELGIYALDDWDITPLLKLSYGLRISGFAAEDTFYAGPEPRLALRYRLSEKTSFKASYTYMNQYLHLVSNSGASFPTDFWYPSNNVVKPQRAQQVAAGITTLLFGEKLVLTDEIYYKDLRNQIDFRDGAQLFFNPQLDEEFVFGRGWSYGNEIFLEKREGKLTGWIGYTLAWTKRKFDDINDGEAFSPKFDNRHDLNIVLSYKVNRRLNVSGTWIYTTGNMISMPTGYVFVNDLNGARNQVVPYYPRRQNFRQPSYHRADIGMVYKFFPKWGESDLSFSIYNLYNRLNPFFIFIDSQFSPSQNQLRLPVSNQAKQVSLFPIIPSLTYNFKF